jgi:hypothetical protein
MLDNVVEIMLNKEAENYLPPQIIRVKQPFDFPSATEYTE